MANALGITFDLTPIENLKDVLHNGELSDCRMSSALPKEWTAEAVRRVNTITGVYTDVPMVCLGKENCEFGKYCEAADDLVDEEFKGRKCGVEVLNAYKILAGYIVDLQIQPTEFADIQLVVDLVRLHLQMRRCDLYQKDHPLYDETPIGVSNKTGQAIYAKRVNMGFEAAREIRRDISQKYKELMASRREKLEQSVKQSKVAESSANIIDIIRRRRNEQGKLIEGQTTESG